MSDDGCVPRPVRVDSRTSRDGSEGSTVIETAIILAGGLGTRLRPVLPATPKVLAPVGGRPFLTWLLDQLATFGMKRAVLCTGHKGDEVENAIGPRHGPLAIVYSREHEPLGTGGALRQAALALDAELVLALNGDSYCGYDLGALAAVRATHPRAGVVLLAEVADARSYGRVDVDASGRVLAFREKDEAAEAGLINAGVYLLDVAALRGLPARRPLSLEREVFPTWTDGRLYGCVAPGPFIDIGIPGRYKIAHGILDTESRRS